MNAPKKDSFETRFQARLDGIVARDAELAERLTAPDLPPSEMATVSQERSFLAPLVEAIDQRRDLKQKIQDLKQWAADLEKEDPALAEEAHDEMKNLEEQWPMLEKNLHVLLLPKDDADNKNVIMEIRQGAGGGEAALFAKDLWTMYSRYAERKGWRTEVMSVNQTDLKGVKEVIFSIQGAGAFAHLKFESGVHRIQRVPETEAGGRVHTSAATVAVLPEVEAVDVQINDEDLRIDTYRASGAGGQHVNKTESAVRITHLPTGVVVQQQDEKSQHKNKARAMKILRARLYDKQRSEAEAKRASQRKLQVGSGDRSGRIRTYNVLQGRVTDHRINLTVHQIENVLGGQLDGLVDALVAEDQAERLAEVQES